MNRNHENCDNVFMMEFCINNHSHNITLLYRGPELLKFVPGQKANDLNMWLQTYRYWNQGGLKNAASMLQLLQSYYLSTTNETSSPDLTNLPELEVTPDIGLLHPLLLKKNGEKRYLTSPKEYIMWRESQMCKQLAVEKNFSLAPSDAPRVAILLYRKHVITDQRYIFDLITIMEEQGILPVSLQCFCVYDLCPLRYLIYPWL